MPPDPTQNSEDNNPEISAGQGSIAPPPSPETSNSADHVAEAKRSGEASLDKAAGQGEPVEVTPIPTTVSEPFDVPPEPVEAPTSPPDPVPLNNTTTKEPPSSADEEGNRPDRSDRTNGSDKTDGEVPASSADVPPTSSADKLLDKQMVQIPVFDPLPMNKQKGLWRRFLEKVQMKKRKKLEKIMSLFDKNSKATNNDVEKLLHVSDSTAQRYLNILAKEGRVRRVGETGKSAFYEKI
jgi:hypothetical protein